MALETKDKTINGRRYLVTQLPAFQALDLLEQLSTVAGPALGGLAKKGLNGEVDFEAAAVQLFSRIGGGKLRGLLVGLLASTVVELPNGKQPKLLDLLDLEYSGRLLEVFKVAAFSAEVNFSDFFGDARSLLAEVLGGAAAASGSTSPSTSSTAGSP